MAASAPFVVTITAVDKATASVQKIKASIAGITKPARDLKASFSSLGKEVGLDRTAKSMKALGVAAADTARSIASVITPLSTIAGIGSIAGIALLANEWGKMGAEVQRTSAVLGVSTEDLQAYRGAAKLAGLSADDMTGSLKSLGRTLEDATYGRNQDALVMMQKFGITLHRTKDGAVDATRALKEVANAIVAQKGNVQAQGLIAGAFGVESLLPLLQKGGKGIDAFVERARSMGLVFDGKQLARGQQFNENMLKLEASATRLKYSFGDSLAPAVERVLNVVGRLVDKYGDMAATKVAEYVEKFAKWLDGVDWAKTADTIGEVVDALGGVKGIAIALAAVTFASPLAGLVSIATQLGVIAAFATNPIVAALAGGWLAESSRQKAFDKAIPAGPNHDQYVAEAMAGGAATPEVTQPPPGGFGKLGEWVKGLFTPSGSKIPRGIRNNNPGNIRYGDFAARMGAVGRDDGGFAIFKSMADGQDASRRLLDSYASRGFDTTRKIISRWAPSSENDTSGYIDEVSKSLGVSPDQTLSSSQLDKLSQAIFRRENGAAAMNAANAGGQGGNGTVHVHVDIPNAPPGTKASVRASGGATATARVGTSNVTGPSV